MKDKRRHRKTQIPCPLKLLAAKRRLEVARKELLPPKVSSARRAPEERACHARLSAGHFRDNEIAETLFQLTFRKP